MDVTYVTRQGVQTTSFEAYKKAWWHGAFERGFATTLPDGTVGYADAPLVDLLLVMRTQGLREVPHA